MTTTVNVQEAKTRLSELLRQVEAGEEIFIARAGRTIARIEAATPRRRNLDAPLLPEIPPIAADALFTGPTELEVDDWEGGDAGDPLVEARPR